MVCFCKTVFEFFLDDELFSSSRNARQEQLNLKKKENNVCLSQLLASHDPRDITFKEL